MIARRRLPVKQNPQSFLHPRKIAENRRKTQKRCNLICKLGAGFTPSVACGDSSPKGTPTLSVTPDGVPAPPRGELFETAAKFLVALETLALRAAACALSVKAYGFASSPKGRAKGTAGNLLFVPNTLASRLTAWLSLRESWRGSA